MGTKMKGLLKGLRYISQIFDEEKEPEMQIGFPTDVKHVAHIGWDGPSVDSPSWMKDFKAPQAFQSAPLNINRESRENPEIKWVSQDSTRRRSLGSLDSPTKDMAELPKTSRRHASADSSSTSEYPTREHSTKSRQSRKNTSESSKTTRQPKDSVPGSDSSSQNLPDIPKKSRRKKSKESVSGESSRPSRSKANAPSAFTSASPRSDPGQHPESIRGSVGSELSQSSSLKPYVKEGEEEGCNGIS